MRMNANNSAQILRGAESFEILASDMVFGRQTWSLTQQIHSPKVARWPGKIGESTSDAGTTKQPVAGIAFAIINRQP
jgi:hypothetical protein